MDKIRAFMLVVCYLSIAIAMLDLLTPNEKLKKQVRMVFSLVFILAIITPIVKGDVTISVPTFAPVEETDEYKKLTERYDEIVVEQFERNIVAAIDTKMKANDYLIDEIYLNVNIDDDNCISISEVNITLSGSADENTINRLIREDIGDAQIRLIKKEDNDG